MSTPTLKAGPPLVPGSFHFPPDIHRVVSGDFLAHLAGLAVNDSWEHATTPELAQLEQWGIALTTADRRSAVAALVIVGSMGLGRALEHAGPDAYQCGFYSEEGSMDGAPVETQLELCAAWVVSPSDDTARQVKAGFDPTRQLNVWDEDLHPTPENCWVWYSEVGQCASLGVFAPDAVKELGEDYYAWPAGLCVGRGLVMAVRGLAKPGVEPNAVIAELGQALAKYA